MPSANVGFPQARAGIPQTRHVEKMAVPNLGGHSWAKAPAPDFKKKSRGGAISIFKIGLCDDTSPSVR